MKATYQALSGNEALAYAMKQINPDVVAAYPITPQTSLMEKFAEYAADGVVDCQITGLQSCRVAVRQDRGQETVHLPPVF